jgi:hypothetical protein
VCKRRDKRGLHALAIGYIYDANDTLRRTLTVIALIAHTAARARKNQELALKALEQVLEIRKLQCFM